jgi:hypothetical protein
MDASFNRLATVSLAWVAGEAPSAFPAARIVPASYGSPHSRHFAARQDKKITVTTMLGGLFNNEWPRSALPPHPLTSSDTALSLGNGRLTDQPGVLIPGEFPAPAPRRPDAGQGLVVSLDCFLQNQLLQSGISLRSLGTGVLLL